MAFLNLSRWVTAGEVPEMGQIMPIPYWAQWWWCFRLGLDRQTVWFSAVVWTVHLIFSSVFWWKYHVCLAICHKSLLSTCLPNTFHDHLCRLWYMLLFWQGIITYIKTSVGIQLPQIARWSLGDCCTIVNCHWSLLVISENNYEPLWIVLCICNILWIFLPYRRKHELRKKYPLWILHITAPFVQYGESVSSKGS